MGTLTLREFRELLEVVPPVLYKYRTGREDASNLLVSPFPPSVTHTHSPPRMDFDLPCSSWPVLFCFLIPAALGWPYGYSGTGLGEAAPSAKLISPVITARMKLTGRHGISDQKAMSSYPSDVFQYNPPISTPFSAAHVFSLSYLFYSILISIQDQPLLFHHYFPSLLLYDILHQTLVQVSGSPIIFPPPHA
ncbi:hypothetical protein HOY82DRAFT_575400 [Tuber indicum]|nr:hypothetical protein HOY82DRAFT_575400 [Tuber indicum]